MQGSSGVGGGKEHKFLVPRGITACVSKAFVQPVCHYLVQPTAKQGYRWCLQVNQCQQQALKRSATDEGAGTGSG